MTIFEEVLKTIADAAVHGIRHDLTDAEYFAHSAINCSGLKLISSKTPLHFKHQQTAPRKETAAMTIGSAVHCAVLEPEHFAQRYIVAPDVDKRTKAGKEAWAELEASGKVVLSHADFMMVSSIATSVMNHPTASKLLTGGAAEVAVFGEIDGVPAKCKCDYLREGVAIIDLKTTDDAGDFSRSVSKWGYHQQAAWYQDVMISIGQPVRAFIFVVVEKSAPYAVATYELSEEWIEIGRQQNQRALSLFKNCTESGKWFGYGEGIEMLSPPAWATRQEELLTGEQA
ncbi:MAG: PD-(D/E)XK nuclease-like domain-containing protein [Methylococcaceae bacterium]